MLKTDLTKHEYHSITTPQGEYLFKTASVNVDRTGTTLYPPKMWHRTQGKLIEIEPKTFFYKDKKYNQLIIRVVLINAAVPIIPMDCGPLPWSIKLDETQSSPPETNRRPIKPRQFNVLGEVVVRKKPSRLVLYRAFMKELRKEVS